MNTAVPMVLNANEALMFICLRLGIEEKPEIIVVQTPSPQQRVWGLRIGDELFFVNLLTGEVQCGTETIPGLSCVGPDARLATSMRWQHHPQLDSAPCFWEAMGCLRRNPVPPCLGGEQCELALQKARERREALLELLSS